MPNGRSKHTGTGSLKRGTVINDFREFTLPKGRVPVTCGSGWIRHGRGVTGGRPVRPE